MRDFFQNESKRAQGEKKAYVIETLQKKKSYLSGALTWLLRIFNQDPLASSRLTKKEDTTWTE